MNSQRNHQRSATITGSRILVVAVLATLGVGFLIASAERGFGQPEKKPAAAPAPGLKGILPAEVPDALVLEEFDPLGKTWTKWSEAVSAQLSALYEAENPSAAGQQKAITMLRSLLKTADSAIQSKATQPAIRNTLVSLRSRILRRIDIAEAALNSLVLDPASAKKHRLARMWPIVQTHLTSLQSHLGSYDGGKAWAQYLQLQQVQAAVRQGNARAESVVYSEERIRGWKQLPEQVQRDFLGHQKVQDFGRALRAVLKVHRMPIQANQAKLRSELKKLITSLEKYESTNSATASAVVRNSFDNISDLSADGGAALGRALRVHYFNYNLRVYIAEPFLNRFIAECRTERGTIRDRVLTADVYGNQVTTTNIGVNLKPSRSDARFDITLAGYTRSSTIGVTSFANIYTDGQHQFWAAKEVRFDGMQFNARQSARISVNANNRTTGAKTKISWIPLLGNIADGIAKSEARKRKGQSEAIARQKISGKVSTQFNEQVETKFAEANRDFKDKILKSVEDAGLKPNAQAVRTTSDLLLLSSRVMNNAELAGSATNLSDAPGWGVTVRLHESAMNNAFNRLNIAGRTMTESELMEEIQKPIQKLLSTKKKPAATKPKPKKKSDDKFLFDASDPIRFRIRNGMLNIVLRVGLKRPGQPDIPTQVITIPLKITVVGKEVLIKRGTVGVAPAKPPKNRAEQIARAGIMRNKIQDAVEDRKVDAVFKIGQDGGKKTMRIAITRIAANNGWVTVWAK